MTARSSRNAIITSREMDYSKYKTDKERADVAHLVPPQYYITLLDWASEATDPVCKHELEHYAWRAFHIETD